jgi:epsilon-lactone hydrolase
MPSPQMQRIIDALRQRQAGRAGQPPRPLEEIRAAYAPTGQFLPLPDDVAVSAVDADGVHGYWLDAPGAEPDRFLLFIHGGGYSLGSLRSHGPLAARIGRETRRRVLFPEYRLAPEHPFPAAVNDVLATWRWLTAEGADPATVAAIGDSAGGGLTLALLQALRDSGQATPAAAVLISPWIDLTLSGASMDRRAAEDPVLSRARLARRASDYLNGTDPRDPAASPLFASHAGLPPLLIQSGSAEVLLSDAERLAEAAARDGVNVTLNVADGLHHVYHGALDTPETATAIRQIAQFATNPHKK